MKNFYITSTLPYTNSSPHLGFALEIIQTDVLARYHGLRGERVFFNTGTDEHGLKIYRAALDNNLEPQKYVDKYAREFKDLLKVLNISNTYFVRTTDERHVNAAQEFWKRCFEKGDIYKTKYRTKYCVGCELEKTESELEDDKCPIHPNLNIEKIEEENYFFRFSKYQKPLLKFYEGNPDFVLPYFRFNEIKQFVGQGLKDFSISRLKSKLPWGVPVPNDSNHCMFVWFDALVGYISALGWLTDARFSEFWPGVQIAGKDNLRQQSAIWQAMLMSAGLPNSKQILIHGFVTVDGHKMSKSLGNVIDPFQVVEKYGTDVVRYFLLREIPSGEDGDFSYKKLEDRYNGDLANGLGNLVQRTVTLIDNNLSGELIYKPALIEKEVKDKINELFKEYVKNLDSFLLHEALGRTWDLIGFANKYIDEEKPWIAAKADAGDFLKIMNNAAFILYNIAWMLTPFLPETADKIFTALGADRDVKTLENYKFRVQKTPPSSASRRTSEGRSAGLFPRLN